MIPDLLDDPFFAFGPLGDEVSRRLRVGAKQPREIMESLISEAGARGLDANDQAFLWDLYSALSGLGYHEGGSGYLIHPIRVAAACMRDGDAHQRNQLALALCHNIREAAGGAGADIERRYLAPAGRSALDRLTIDRDRERDPAYLAEFYNGIAEAGLMKLKGHDKLDNMLGYVVESHEAYHYEMVLDYVCPRLDGPAPALATYLREATDFVRIPGIRRRFAFGESNKKAV